MSKKVIYVDFVFKHKKVSYFKYYILYLISNIRNSFRSFKKVQNKSFTNNKKRKMLK
ncbi:hypothetical protein SAMN04487886_10878 [Clostridium sp. DSM 8431]|nr:hypothetical protein SAMN04487886_10878 [Clostridium sp. DSM 8431]